MLDGFTKYDYLTGGIVAIVAILMVFLILVLIIFLTELVAKALKGEEKEEQEESVVKPVESPIVSRLDLNDENATVAALVASIDYRLKNKTNVRVVSIREVK